MSPIYHSYPLDAIHIQVDPGWSRLTRFFVSRCRHPKRCSRHTLGVPAAALPSGVARCGERIWKERKEPTLPSYPPLFTGNSHKDHWVALTNLFYCLSTSSQLEMASQQTQANPCVKHVRWSYTRNVAQIITASHSLPSVSQGGAEHETTLLQAVEEVCAEETGTAQIWTCLWLHLCVFFCGERRERRNCNSGANFQHLPRPGCFGKKLGCRWVSESFALPSHHIAPKGHANANKTQQGQYDSVCHAMSCSMLRGQFCQQLRVVGVALAEDQTGECVVSILNFCIEINEIRYTVIHYIIHSIIYAIYII